MKHLTLFIFVSIIFVNTSSGQETVNLTTEATQVCDQNAAKKLLDMYYVKSGQVHNILDIDIRVRNSTPTTSFISLRWVSKTHNGKKTSIVSGRLEYRDRDQCCGAIFFLRDSSEDIIKDWLPSNLGCTADFIQESMGTGKPFTRISVTSSY